MNLTRRMFLKWAMVAAASPGPLLVEPKFISIPAASGDFTAYLIQYFDDLEKDMILALNRQIWGGGYSDNKIRLDVQ